MTLPDAGFRWILVIGVASRLAAISVGVVANTTTLAPGGEATVAQAVRNLPSSWDASWYVGIASGGYRYTDGGGRFQRIAFFPAYPLLLRGVARLGGVPRTPNAWAWVGVALSVLCFSGALLYLFSFTVDAFGARAGEGAVVLCAAYPFSVFFGAAYTESLYLLASLGCLYHVRQGQWVRAAAWGGVVGLTRPNGFLLCIPAAVIAGATPPDAAVGRRRWLWVAAAAPIGGMLIYSSYIYHLTGDPFAWAKVQSSWGRMYLGPTGALVDVFQRVRAAGVLGFLERWPYDALNASALVAALCCVVPAWRVVGAWAAAFVLLNILPPLLVGGVPSMGRYSAVLFPIYMWLAIALPRGPRDATVTVFGMFQGLAAALHYTSRPLF